MDERFVAQSPPSAELMALQRRENEMARRQWGARLLSLTPRTCIREAAQAAVALYGLLLHTDAAAQDVVELFQRPNMPRGVGLLLACVAACLLLVSAMMSP